nr:hypothetical protein [Tanacetum cinerariifolium]
NDESLPDEDVPAEEFKIYSNPLCDEDEINSDKLDRIVSMSNLILLNLCLIAILLLIFLLNLISLDGNSQQEEIDIVTETEDLLPPSVEYDDDDYSKKHKSQSKTILGMYLILFSVKDALISVKEALILVKDYSRNMIDPMI